MKLFYLTFALCVLSFTSCQDKSSLPPSERLEGDWIITKTNGDPDDINLGTLYSFHDNKMSTSKNDFEVKGDYTATDSTITWQLEDFEMNYSYHFNDDLLHISLSGGQEFDLEEQ